MKYLLAGLLAVCVLSGCTRNAAKVAALAGKTDATKPLTADERERWEKVRAQAKKDMAIPDKNYQVVLLYDKLGWAAFYFHKTIRNDNTHYYLTLQDATAEAQKDIKNPSIDCAAVVDFFTDPDPKIISYTRDRKSDAESLAAYLLSVQKGLVK